MDKSELTRLINLAHDAVAASSVASDPKLSELAFTTILSKLLPNEVFNYNLMDNIDEEP